MAAFNFPNSPSTNDTHTENGVTYKWNGTVWKRQNTSYTDATNLNVTGIGTFAGAVHIGGVLTYEDVKNVDSVGVITARGVIDAQGYINLAQKIIHTGDADTSIEFPSNDTIKFETAGTERIRITSAGRVGVGNRTSNPDELLHVHTGSGQANIHVEGATDGQIILRAHSGNSVIHFGDASSTSVGKILYEHNNDEFVFNTSATERVRITASGIITKYDTRNVSIRNAAGTTRGHLQANGSGIDLQSHVNSSGFITFSTNGGGTPAERLRITSAGAVGVGTAIPGAEFEVRGAGTVALFKGTGGNCFIGLTDVDAGAGVGYIGSDGGALLFQTPGSSYSTKLTIDSSGLISNGGLSPSDYGSPKLLISGTNSLFTMMGNGAINNSSYTGIKFRVAGGSTGDYTKAGIFVVRQASYNYLDMLFCFNTAANATGVSDGDEKVRIKSDSSILHTRTDNVGRYDVEFRNTGGIGNGNYGGIVWKQGSTGSTFLSGIQIAYHDTGRPDMVFWIRDKGGSAGSDEGMRINRDGKLLVGRNSAITITGDGSSHVFEQNTNNGYALATHSDESNKRGIGIYYSNSSGASDAIRFAIQSAAKFIVLGSGNCQNANNSYGNISDISLKENIVDAESQWDDIKNIKIRNFNFKESSGQETHKQIGVVAQELETVCPKLVDSSGKGGIKAVASSILYMKAVKALQEAMERIETLEAEVAALKSA